MLKNYFKIALRNLKRNKGYAAINVAGLAVGMAACLLIGLYVQSERSYDRFHERADRIYRVTWTTGFGGTAAVPASMLPKFKDDFAEVEAATHLAGGRLVVRQGGEWVQEEDFLYADPSVFDVFSFPLQRGNPDAALREPGTVVLTETTARRYFGDGDPLGQTLMLNDASTLRVTGVLADVPTNSHLQFDALVSLVTLTGVEGLSKHDQALGFMGWQYLLLTAPEAAAAVDARLDEIVEQGQEVFSAYFGWWLEDSSFDLQALTRIHLHSGPLGRGGRERRRADALPLRAHRPLHPDAGLHQLHEPRHRPSGAADAGGRCAEGGGRQARAARRTIPERGAPAKPGCPLPGHRAGGGRVAPCSAS